MRLCAWFCSLGEDGSADQIIPKITQTSCARCAQLHTCAYSHPDTPAHTDIHGVRARERGSGTVPAEDVRTSSGSNRTVKQGAFQIALILEHMTSSYPITMHLGTWKELFFPSDIGSGR